MGLFNLGKNKTKTDTSEGIENLNNTNNFADQLVNQSGNTVQNNNNNNIDNTFSNYQQTAGSFNTSSSYQPERGMQSTQNQNFINPFSSNTANNQSSKNSGLFNQELDNNLNNRNYQPNASNNLNNPFSNSLKSDYNVNYNQPNFNQESFKNQSNNNQFSSDNRQGNNVLQKEIASPLNSFNENNLQMRNAFDINAIQNTLKSESLQITKEDVLNLVNETIEKIMDEKWNEITENIKKVIKWKDRKEEEINSLRENIIELTDTISKLESKMVNRISGYDKNILDVNSEIKALEKVFQKITPTLINNVNELSRITDTLKSSSPKDVKKTDFNNMKYEDDEKYDYKKDKIISFD